jgi:hypothetical protein
MDGVSIQTAVAESGNTRVLGSPWRRYEPGGGSEILLRYANSDMVNRYMHGERGLTGELERMFLAVHECGHAFAMHATGMPYGGVTISDGPEPRDGRSDLHRLARADRLDLPRTALEATMLALGGWVSSETWLELTVVDGHRLRANELNRVHAHVAAADDHYNLMCFPTPSPTVYLYGRVQAPDGWRGEMIAIDGITTSLTTLMLLRWPQLMRLATLVVQQGTATTQEITDMLGASGWAI